MAKISAIIAILSIIFGISGIAGVVALYDSIAQREAHWNKVFNERLLQLDIALKGFVDTCTAYPEVKDVCDFEFAKIWDTICNRELDWDKIDSCKRIQGFLIRS